MRESILHPPEPFASPEERHHATLFGMWLFLASEVMLFGALFLGLTIYRVLYAADFTAASRHMDLGLGTANTAVLLTSSLTMALAVRAARTDAPRLTALWLFATAGLGVVFLGVKGLEYAGHLSHGLWPGHGFAFEPASVIHARLFFWFYFLMTGLHALHVAVGIAVTGLLGLFAWRKAFVPGRSTPVEAGGLYWHFVDVVWIFLFPMLYLIAHR